MRALVAVGLVFAAITLWAVTFSSPTPLLAPSATSPPVRRTVAEKRAHAVAFLEAQLAANPTVPGVALSIVYEHETVLVQGFGTTHFGQSDTPVTAHTLFQIGSYTKTLVALGIAKLVDDGFVAWSDPVKYHLPSFQLQDKYAERYTTLGDLLAMNSVLDGGDLAWVLGVAPSEAALVQRLAEYNTTRPLRSGYLYANLNFEILGQVIEAVANHSHWFDYLRAAILTPLNMTETYGRPADAPTSALAAGHLTCGSHVLGPYSLVESIHVMLSPRNDYLAAGSIVSSAADLAKLSHFLLSNGHPVFQSTETLDAMTTGHVVLGDFVVAPLDAASRFGYSYSRDGNVVASGYGFDVVGDILFGFDYFSKSGDTRAFKQRNGFVPSRGLGVSLVTNYQPSDVTTSFFLDRIRSYVMGVFLDVPQDALDAMLLAGGTDPGTECDAHYFGHASWDQGLVVPAAVQTLLVGTYAFTESPAFYGPVHIFVTKTTLMLHSGEYTFPLYPVSPTSFVWGFENGVMTFTLDIVVRRRDNTTTITFLGMEMMRT
ncbi:Aste57867_894 [Aphanomyces stellatus]|uniref:Aste57867_894 protein n=1 Tax=Aphanomyces stellatus TaxID=120398 RepID=A0A485K8V5_9STRA|nr:hypothetical protein As57867_000893 [Aphanomyces stellatus]VFT78118.1 Aste57867_894 [Aphanomyces stellatus]